jgi:formate/nitrite transporter FocA (FNT family)
VLSWSSFFVDNLVPVAIGNVVGGTIFVGLVYWYVYRTSIAANDPSTSGSDPG